MNYTFDFSFLPDYAAELLGGALLTLKLTGLATLLGMLFGTLCAVAHSGRSALVRRAVTVYVEVIRNTPLIVQAFWLYFGLAVLGLHLSAVQAAIVALTVNVTAYTSEIIRGGMGSIHRSQIEAAESLGLSRWHILFDVVIPPAVEKVYPALTSQFVLMMLASSIMSQISAEELTAIGGRIQSETFRGLEVYLVIATIYVGLSVFVRGVLRGVAYVAFPRQRRARARARARA